MSDLPEDILCQGVSVDIEFDEPRPTFGDLYLICGDIHPDFPPSGAYAFGGLVDLQFEQVDDYFGVRSLNDEGADVPVWLYPIVKGHPVFHHAGPFDAIRIDYNILRNPSRRSAHYLLCVEQFADLGVRVHYRNRDLVLTKHLTELRADIQATVQHWADQGIVVGSSKALKIAF